MPGLTTAPPAADPTQPGGTRRAAAADPRAADAVHRARRARRARDAMSVAAANSSTEPSVDRSAVGVPAASALWVLIAGVVGLAAAFTLTIEKIKLLDNPAYVPSCSINPVLSCGSVMATPQAAAFGFPNPLIGVVAFSVVVVTGVLAVAKVPLPRWYWAGLAVGHHCSAWSSSTG